MSDKDYTAEPLVRCEDCVYNGKQVSKYGSAIYTCEKHLTVDGRFQIVEPDDFCCWGVRKDDDTN